MQIEHLISISFTPEELKDALLSELGRRIGSPLGVVQNAHDEERLKIIKHIRNNIVAMDWGEDGKFHLSSDGIAKVEDF